MTTVVDATKHRIDRDAALQLVAGAERILVVKRKSLVLFDAARSPIDEATLLAEIIGPTGNLRAPTARIGTTFIVGFNELAYQQLP